MTTYYTYPTVRYSDQSNIDYSPQVLRNVFGDRYVQVIGDGINTLPRTVNLRHNLLSLSESNTLLAFLKAHSANGDVVTIKNLMEDPTGATTINCTIESFKKDSTDGQNHTYSVTLLESFL